MAEAVTGAYAGKGRPAEILLVEDNPGDVILTRKVFSTLKFANTIHVAEDADSALSQLKSKNIDLVLLDINMPKKGGLSLLEEIRKDAKLAQIPVMMLTSSKAPSDMHASLHLDANSYIVKPLNIEKLALALTKLPNFWFGLIISE